jgi:CDP-4-dehydro-6-deoxyglucose reductase
MVDSARRDFVQKCGLPETEFYADSFTTEADLAQPSQPAVVSPAPSPR